MTFKVKTFYELLDPILVFVEDAKLAEENVDTSDSQFNRRTMVRALFAMIEGTIFFLKQAALATAIQRDILNTGELLLLKEEIPELTSTGQCRMQTKFIKLNVNLKFVSCVLQKLYGFNLKLGIGTTDWDYFGKSIEIRNRITHPKSSSDFWISDEDLQNIREVSSWFCDLTIDAVEQLYATIVVPRLHDIDQNLNQLSDSNQ